MAAEAATQVSYSPSNRFTAQMIPTRLISALYAR
jgi:hypothetical protein